MSEQPSTGEQVIRGTGPRSIDAGRTYVRALLDQDGRAREEAREAYAESLVDQHCADDARKVVWVALQANEDGYYAGLVAGQKDALQMARHVKASSVGASPAAQSASTRLDTGVYNEIRGLSNYSARLSGTVPRGGHRVAVC